VASAMNDWGIRGGEHRWWFVMMVITVRSITCGQ